MHVVIGLALMKLINQLCGPSHLFEESLQTGTIQKVEFMKLNAGAQKLLYPVNALWHIPFSSIQNRM